MDVIIGCECLIAYIRLFNGRDGRLKVIGGDNIEGLLVSPKQLPYKYLEVRVIELLKLTCS